jgi:hypothetical protein
MKNLLALVLSAALVLVATPSLAVDDPVELTYGQVSGVELENGVTVF